MEKRFCHLADAGSTSRLRLTHDRPAWGYFKLCCMPRSSNFLPIIIEGSTKTALALTYATVLRSSY